ncbi:hypothetical protein SDC9_199771 [bioreactor metagenome]|uniref:Uncharacterized protein n=1 Tax=bioreactor metagenome TaxID=1076179 RepID=A0A645ILH5_9ZZZZ
MALDEAFGAGGMTMLNSAAGVSTGNTSGPVLRIWGEASGVRNAGARRTRLNPVARLPTGSNAGSCSKMKFRNATICPVGSGALRSMNITAGAGGGNGSGMAGSARKTASRRAWKASVMPTAATMSPRRKCLDNDAL